MGEAVKLERFSLRIFAVPPEDLYEPASIATCTLLQHVNGENRLLYWEIQEN